MTRLYINLESEWTINGEKHSQTTSRSYNEGEDVFALEAADIKKENPKAKNIVVVEPPANEGFPFAVDQLIDIILTRRSDIDRAVLEEYKWLLLPEGRSKYSRGAFITTLPEAKAIFNDEEADYDDWIYFKEFNFVIFNVTKHTSHEIFMAHWYFIIKDVLNTTIDFETFTDSKLLRLDNLGTENFLHAKYGFYKTSAYGVGVVSKSANFKLNAQEKIVFNTFKFRDYEPK